MLEAGDRRLRARDPVRAAVRGRPLHRDRRPGHAAGCSCAALFCAICLLPPTLLMGATLPAIARWVETTPTRRVVARLLLRRQHRRRRVRLPARRLLPAARPRHDVRDVRRRRDQLRRRGRSAFASAKCTPHDAARRRLEGAARCDDPAGRRGRSTSTIALSGMTALGAEVVWTRLLSLLLGATTYTFSLILAGVPDRARHRQQRRLAASRAT